MERDDEHLTELNEAVRRAGYIVTEQIDSIIERAERQAETILRDAERDAEDMRREAADAAKRLLDRLQALEFPLGELVVGLRDEVDQVTLQLKGAEHVDSEATSLPSGQEGAESDEEEVVVSASSSEGEAEAVDSFSSEGEGAAALDEEEGAGPAAAGPDASEPEVVAAVGQEGAPSPGRRGKAGRRGRRGPRGKRAQTAFITTEGQCAVCDRTFMAGDELELEQSGWSVNGDVGLCPDCQADEWQLPAGARLPVRPGGR